MKVLLVGTGPMAAEYVKVLQAMGVDFSVVGRGENSARVFEAETGVGAITGGLEVFLANPSSREFTHAIVATGVEQLGRSSILLKEAGINTILVEKPAGLDLLEVRELGAFLQDMSVFIAYNRRFFASVNKAREMIKEDGGVKSFSFEFTEWSSQIEPLKKAEGVKENWFLANSSHVVDLAFHLGGVPEQLSSYIAGELSWHKPAIFAGSGISDTGALFTYSANWDAPGRWGVELLTSKRRFFLRPMEKLSVQVLQSVAITEVAIDDELDKSFKPGLYNQVRSFLYDPTDPRLCKLEDHIRLLPTYSTMTGYTF